MLRRTTAILATAAAITLAVVAPAPAQTTPRHQRCGGYRHRAPADPPGPDASAVSQTQAAVGQNAEGVPFATADGAALLLAGTAIPGAAPSFSPGGPESNEACPLELDLNEATQGALSGLQLEIACTRTTATSGEHLAAHSESGEVVIRVLGPGGAILEPILGPALAGVEQITDPLVEALAPLLGAIKDATQIDVANVLDQLLTAVGDDLFVLAEIVVAPSVSQASATSEGVIGQAGSNAITINVLPGLASTLDELTNLIDVPLGLDGPLLQVKLGAANAKGRQEPRRHHPAGRQRRPAAVDQR